MNEDDPIIQYENLVSLVPENHQIIKTTHEIHEIYKELKEVRFQLQEAEKMLRN